MDRTTTNIAKAQDGFIKNLIKPAFVMLQKAIPKLDKNIQYMDENVENWAGRVIEYSVMTHSQLETINEKNKPIKMEDEEGGSSDSDDSFVKEAIEDHKADNKPSNWSNVNTSSRKELVSLKGH